MQNRHDNLDFDDAFLHCKKIAKNHYENFPVASVLIPKNKRKYVYAVYAFARFADDIADSAVLKPKEKIERLNSLDSELTKIEKNELSDLLPDNAQTFIALYKTIQDLNIPIEELRNLLTAFKQDSVKHKYDSFNELLDYSNYSANPIGHLVLYIFGYNRVKDKKLFELSDYICTGLQLINFWQDVARDLEINRVYIPEEVLQKYNYSYELLYSKVEDERYIGIIKELIGKTKEIFKKGENLPALVKGRLKYELKATYYGGLTVINKIEKLNYRTLTTRPVVSGSDKFKIFIKTFF